MKYAIFVDVDGTLLDNKQQIPESAVYAIKNARKNGHYVFLNTGRCKAELFESILDVGFDGIYVHMVDTLNMKDNVFAI